MRRTRIPMKISVGNLRLFQGLTLRQVAWTGAGITLAGLVGLADIDLLVKVPFIVAILAAVFLIAYYRTTDDPLEVWLLRRLGFQRGARGYVFKGHAAPPSIVVVPGRMGSAPSPRTRAHQPDSMALPAAWSLTGQQISLAGVILGFWIVASLSAVLIHLLQSVRVG